MKSSRSRRVFTGAALVLSLTLAGCAGADPSAAAVAGDRVVKERDVQTAVSELAGLGFPQPPAAGEVTQLLVIGPMLLDNLREAGYVVSETQARASLADPAARLSEPTVEVLKAVSGIGALEAAQGGQAQPQPGGAADPARILAAGEQTTTEINEGVQSGSIVLNPKYDNRAANWIVDEQNLGLTPQP